MFLMSISPQSFNAHCIGLCSELQGHDGHFMPPPYSSTERKRQGERACANRMATHLLDGVGGRLLQLRKLLLRCGSGSGRRRQLRLQVAQLLPAPNSPAKGLGDHHKAKKGQIDMSMQICAEFA
jgi:hypothetical protein